ncbi:efflux RND transporter permease subunit [bacterium]|nr:efflux RND transporter permease subunit [bacterium]
MTKSKIINYLSNLRLIFFGYLVVIGVGVWSWLTLPRELMPSVELPVAIVSVVLPGASPQDVEDLVVVPLEDKLRSLSGIDQVQSTSMESAGVIIMQFDENQDIDDLVQKIRDRVDSTALPDNANDPTVTKIDFDEEPVWTFAISGEDKLGLSRVAEKVQEDLERQSLIDRVEISGLQTREIVVHMEPTAMVKYGVHPAVLAQTVAAATSTTPAGSLNLGNMSYAVSLEKQVADIDTLRQMSVILNGVEYQLGDIADIYEQEQPGGTNSYQLHQDGQIQQVVTLNVYKTAGSDIDASADLARRTASTTLQAYPQYTITNITDLGQEITDTFDKLFLNIIETVALVFVIMFIFLGIREASISAISIPMVMLLTFGCLKIFDLTLNFITLFGLLLALGMLVDNAIVVVTALSRAFFDKKTHPTALQAGEHVWREFFVALISTNLTTIWAFLPLLVVSGIMGQFIRPIGIIVTIAMLGSALVAFLLTLPLGIFVLEPRLPVRLQKFLVYTFVIVTTLAFVFFLPKTWLLLPIILLYWLTLYLAARLILPLFHYYRSHRRAKRSWFIGIIQNGFINTNKLENWYQRQIERILTGKHSKGILIVAILILTLSSFSLPLLGLVHSEFFPKEEADSFELILTLPTGTNSQEAERLTLELLPQLAQGVPGLDYLTAQVGRGGSSSLVSSGGSSNQVLFTFNLIDEKLRPVSSIELAQRVRDKWKYNPYGEVQVTESSTISSGGSDIQMYIIGEDLDILATKAEQMVAWLQQQPGIVDAKSDLQDTSKRLVFVPNHQVATQYGLSSSDFAVWLRSTLSGWKLGSLRQDEDNIDITLRQQAGIPEIEELEKIQIPLSGVGYVPITSLGEFRVEPSLAQIVRQDFSHGVTVTATVKDGYSSTEINTAFEKFIDHELDLPAGYSRQVGGQQEMNQQAMTDLYLAMFLAFVLILITLVIQLRSFRKAFIVMSVIPVAISGVFINFALFGISLTLPAIIGILALFGIVVNNSILIVERINQNLNEGQAFLSSVVNGCTTRLQPILLTSLTTIIGLLPITFSRPLWQGLGGAIICGLTFSGILLLLYIPALYVIMFDPQKLAASDAKWRQSLAKLSK